MWVATSVLNDLTHVFKSGLSSRNRAVEYMVDFTIYQ